MLNRTMITVIWTAAVLALGTIAVAQTPGVAERFTFVAANGSKAGPSGEGRLQIVINQWSPDAERDRLLSVLKEDGSDKLAEAFRLGPLPATSFCPVIFSTPSVSPPACPELMEAKISSWPRTTRCICGGTPPRRPSHVVCPRHRDPAAAEQGRSRRGQALGRHETERDQGWKAIRSRGLCQATDRAD